MNTSSLIHASRRLVKPVKLAMIVLAFIVLASMVQSAHAERLRDLASIAGVRQNQLIGYGLVVGLDGTGDQTTQTPFTTQSLNNMLSQLGITVPTGTNMQLKNVAAVMITASYPCLLYTSPSPRDS